MTTLALKMSFTSSFFFQAEDGIRDGHVTGVQTCALPILSLGAVQIAADGMPIILSVEQQTTGGYAKMANVISADFGSLGQLRPRDEIRFRRVTFETARKLLMEQEKLLTAKDSIVET